MFTITKLSFISAILLWSMIGCVSGAEEGGGLGIELRPIYQENIPSELEDNAVSSRMNALSLSIRNLEQAPAKLLWGDFFVRSSGGSWIGGWWAEGQIEPELLAKAFGRDEAEGGFGLDLPPAAELKCTLSDPWIDDSDHMEYKFVALVQGGGGEVHLLESNAVEATPININSASVVRAVNGISEAVGHLFKPWGSKEKMPAAGDFGVTVEHTMLGPVEAMKNEALLGKIRQWQDGGDGDTFYAYRTEIANNTTHPVEVVLAETLTLCNGVWLSGAQNQSLRSQYEIVDGGYIQSNDGNGMPKVKKATTSRIEPGQRMVLPSNWHPHMAGEEFTQVRWRVVTLGDGGELLYSSGDTPAAKPNLLLPKTSGGGDEKQE